MTDVLLGRINPRNRWAGALAKHRAHSKDRLVRGLADMIESGRLTAADIPDDFEWLCDAMARAGRKVNPPSQP